MVPAENIVHGRESRPVRHDGLVLISQHHETGCPVITGQDHQLGFGVILDFVHHDITGIFVFHTGKGHFQIQALGSCQPVPAQQAPSDGVCPDPGEGSDLVERTGKLVLDPVPLLPVRFFPSFGKAPPQGLLQGVLRQ